MLAIVGGWANGPRWRLQDSTMRIDLDVPYHQKDDAKRLGAKWDPIGKTWYVPDGVDPAPLARWRPAEGDFNLRAAEAYLVRSPERCWRCAAPYRAIAFLMAPGYQIRDDDDDGETGVFWSDNRNWAFAHYISALPSPISEMLKSEAPNYRRAFSQTAQSTYWANHCPACNALQGDFELFCEPEGAFFPIIIDQVRAMRATRLAVFFEAQGNPALSIDDGGFIPGVDLRWRRPDGEPQPEARDWTIRADPLVGRPLPRAGRSSLMGRLKSLIGLK